MSLPIGRSEGLPIGGQVIAPRLGEAEMIVEALLNQIRIERPTGQVLVKGRVERLSAWPKSSPRHLFGELVGSERGIEARLVPDAGYGVTLYNNSHVKAGGNVLLQTTSGGQDIRMQWSGSTTSSIERTGTRNGRIDLISAGAITSSGATGTLSTPTMRMTSSTRSALP